MLFNTFSFLLFLSVVFVLYYFVVPKKWQLYLLIAANLFFYGFQNPRLLTLLLFAACTDAIVSFLLQRLPQKRLITTLGVASQLSLLIIYKYPKLLYETFFVHSPLASPLHFMLAIPLPIGISFYCFQGISLMVDSFWGKVPFGNISFKDHLRRTIFFVSFFPHLIAGPIVRASEFLPQVSVKYFADIDWSKAFRNLVMGYFYKCVIADNLAIFTKDMLPPVFYGRSSLDLIGMLFGYSIQIFADFAGYSFIAIGLAALFGYRFPKNFEYPYISRSFSEFWQRWHISLYSWLRDYLFMPLIYYLPIGSSKASWWRWQIATLITFGLSGLWHGAAWSYAVWGLWHGGLLVAERSLRDLGWRANEDSKEFSGVKSFVQMAVVFLLVSFGWLLFRLPNFQNVVEYLTAIGQNTHIATNKGVLARILLLAVPVVLHHMRRRDFFDIKVKHPARQLFWEYSFYGVVLFLALTSSGDRHEFIYFQF